MGIVSVSLQSSSRNSVKKYRNCEPCVFAVKKMGFIPLIPLVYLPLVPFAHFCQKTDAPVPIFGQGRPTQKWQPGFVKLTVVVRQRPATRHPSHRHSTRKFRIRQPEPLT